MDPQDGKDDRESLLAGTTTKLFGALSEPRAFLLFIFAVLALIEYTNYVRGQTLVKTVTAIIETTTNTVSREQDFNRDMMEGMLRIIETNQQNSQQAVLRGQLAEHTPPRPQQPDPDHPPSYPR